MLDVTRGLRQNKLVVKLKSTAVYITVSYAMVIGYISK